MYNNVSVNNMSVHTIVCLYLVHNKSIMELSVRIKSIRKITYFNYLQTFLTSN